MLFTKYTKDTLPRKWKFNSYQQFVLNGMICDTSHARSDETNNIPMYKIKELNKTSCTISKQNKKAA